MGAPLVLHASLVWLASLEFHTNHIFLDPPLIPVTYGWKITILIIQVCRKMTEIYFASAGRKIFCRTLGQCIRFSTEVKNVGVVLDEHLNLKKHINKIVSHGYKLLKDIGK